MKLRLVEKAVKITKGSRTFPKCMKNAEGLTLLFQKLEKFLTYEEILSVGIAIEGTCPYCWNTDTSKKTCYCQRDD